MSEQEQSTTVEPERPEWLPDNFTKPEDLAKSYNDLQTKLKEQGTESNQRAAQAAELQTRLDQLEAAQHQQQWQHQQSDLAEQWEMAEPAEQLRISAAIAQAAAEAKFAELQAQNPTSQKGSPQFADMATFLAQQTMEGKYQDWADVAPKIGEIVKQDPALFPVSSEDSLSQIVGRLDSLYKLAKAQDAFDQGGTALADLASAAANAKNRASTISGQNGQQTEASDDAAYWKSVTEADPGGYR